MEEKNLEFRAVGYEDIDRLIKWDKESMGLEENSNNFPYSENIIQRFIESSQFSFQEIGRFRFITVEKNKGVIGYIDIYEYDSINNRAKIAQYVDKEHRNKGYGYEMKKFIINHAFNNLNLYQVYWEIYSNNENSFKLTNKFKDVRKIGIKKDWVWKNGKYIDSHQFQIINNKTT
jgi:diamine N-acetyltransferase